MELITVGHAAVTWFMAGVITVIHIVHYPSFRHVGAGTFDAFHRAHTRRISTIVVPAMLVELLLAIGLLFPSSGAPVLQAWVGMGLLVGIWGMTGWVHVPQHARLKNGLRVEVVDALVKSNLVRTVLWQIRALLAALILLS